MNLKNTLLVVGGVVIGLVLAIIVSALVGRTPAQIAGSIANCSGGYTCYTNLDVLTNLVVDGTSQIGASGTALSNVVAAACSMTANVSIAATTSGYAFCTGVTGLTASDGVEAVLATSTSGFVLSSDNWWIISAKASTTPGAIDFLLYNGTGKAAVPSAVGRAASTTIIQAAH